MHKREETTEERLKRLEALAAQLQAKTANPLMREKSRRFWRVIESTTKRTRLRES
jgi:hypothetical protein